MKKFIMVLICCLIIPSIVFADTATDEDIKIILSTMEIIDNDSNENDTITRSELAKILVNASVNKDLVNTSIRLSTFSDVPYYCENASYIRIAAINDYLRAYLDGTFKPDNIVKYEEAITAVLKLLGYTNSDFIQSYPYEQIAIANSLKLTKGIDINIGNEITRKELNRLLYNLINTNVKDSNQLYGNKLGYEVYNDLITLDSIMKEKVNGPITYENGTSLYTLIGLISPTVYVNGKFSSESEINVYDILYYSAGSNTVWAYNEKVTGILENILPNRESPFEIVVSGNTYKLSTYLAKNKFATTGFTLGNMVTLFLDRNNEVADAYLSYELYKEQVGVIISSGKNVIMTDSGDEKNTYYVTVLLPTGETMDIETTTNYNGKVGYMARISLNNKGFNISYTRKPTDIYGKFDLSKGTLGNDKISTDISILEVDDYGNTIKIYPSRLDNVNIKKGEVILAEKNSKGAIDRLIIKQVTGDTANYGILTSINEKNESASYTCVMGESEKNYSNSDIVFNIDEGAVGLYLDGQSLEKIFNLEKFEGSIVNVNNSYVENSKGDKFKLAENVVVLYKSGSNYYSYTIDDAISGEYNVRAYYDEIEEEGGRIRVILLN